MGIVVPLAAPELLADVHELAEFDSGVASLDDWLRRRARGNQTGGTTRTFVVAEGRRAIAYYAVAAGGISTIGALGRFQRNMPDPIPVALLARLAIDRAWQGRGLGHAMFRDCAVRIAHAADSLGIRRMSSTRSRSRPGPFTLPSASSRRHSMP